MLTPEDSSQLYRQAQTPSEGMEEEFPSKTAAQRKRWQACSYQKKQTSSQKCNKRQRWILYNDKGDN